MAEDDLALLALVERILEQDGCEVLAAADGSLALEASRAAEQVDVAVIDVVMPGLDGFGLGDALAEERAGVRAVFTTALTSDDVRATVRTFGCDLLPKPYTPAALRRAVAEARPLKPRPRPGGASP